MKVAGSGLVHGLQQREGTARAAPEEAMNTRSIDRRPMMVAAAMALGLMSLGLARSAGAEPYYLDAQDVEPHVLAPYEMNPHQVDPYRVDPYEVDLFGVHRYEVEPEVAPYARPGHLPVTRVPRPGQVPVAHVPVAPGYELDLRGRISLRDVAPFNRDEARILRRLGPVLDRNRDGRLTAMESRVAAQVIQARRMFVALDRDRDGRLFRNETRGWLRREFDRLDHDRNLSVTWKEVQSALVRDLRRPTPRRYVRPAGVSGWIRIDSHIGNNHRW
jgi:hypothetical protein